LETDVTTRLTAFFLWGVVIAAMVVPIALATTSPYLTYRGPLYIAAGFAGIVAMSLFVLQPLLACPVRALIAPATARRWHRIIGASILILILAHVVGLYFVSPPDTIDASLLRAPTWFSLFGVVALWGAVLTALLAMTRLKLPMRPRSWKRLHQSIASIVVIATALHAIQIEGAMEVMSKTLLAGTIVAATVFAARRYRSP
jgi:predicted ferric reductase